MNTVKITEKTTSSLWNYYRDEPNNPLLNTHVGNNPPTINYNADPMTNSASFKYKSSITGITLDNNDDNAENNNRTKNKGVEIVVPLTLFRMGVGQKGPPTSFSPVTSPNVGISHQNFLTFSFNPFSILVQNVKFVPSASPKLLNLNQDHPSKKAIFLVKSL